MSLKPQLKKSLKIKSAMEPEIDMQSIVKDQGGRTKQLLRMLMVLLAPVTVLLILCGIQLKYSLDQQKEISQGFTKMRNALRATELAFRSRQEGLIAGVILSEFFSGRDIFYSKFRNCTENTDAALKKFRNYNFLRINQNTTLNSLKDIRYHLNSLRSYVKNYGDRGSEEKDLRRVLSSYNAFHKSIMDSEAFHLSLPSKKDIWSKMVAFMALERASSAFQLKLSLGYTYFLPCFIDMMKKHWYITEEATGDTYKDLAIVSYKVVLNIQYM